MANTNKELGMKSRVFIYYLQNVKGNEKTNKFSIEFLDATEKAKYFEMAKEKLSKKFGEKFVNENGWAVNADASILLERDALEAREWLIQNGWLSVKTTESHKGKMKTKWIGVTNNGWQVSPKYLALV